MPLEEFGAFGWICRHAPLVQCNLVFAQVWKLGSDYSVLFPPSTEAFKTLNITSTSTRKDANVIEAHARAGTGVGASCMLPRAGELSSQGDIVLVVMSFLSVLLSVSLIYQCWRRKAAVGRTELSIFVALYGIHSALQAVTMSSMLEQGSDMLIALSSIHTGVIAAMSFAFLYTAVVATQIFRDGSLASLGPLACGLIAFLVGTLYISLSTAHGWNSVFVFQNSSSLKSIPLFVLTLIWPAVAIAGFAVLMINTIINHLHERMPAAILMGGALFLAGGQLVLFLASQPLCTVAHGKVNGAFISCICNNVAVVLCFLVWHVSISFVDEF